MNRRAPVTGALFILALLLGSCGGDGAGPQGPPTPPPPPPPPPPAAVASVAVGPDTTTLVAQQTRQLSATPRDSAGNALTRAVSWSSSTPGVASVSGTGLVTAHGPGSASITATSEGRVGTATVTVRDGLFVGPTGGTLSVGGASVIVPAGAVTTGTAFTVASVAGPPAHPRLVAGTAWLLGPEGSAFAQPVTVRLSWSAAQVAEGALQEQFAVHRWNGTAWTELADRQIDVAARTVSGRTTGFSVFAIIELPSEPRPTLASIEPTQAIAGGNGLTLTATGTDFGAGTVLRWNGAPRPTTVASTTTLMAQITAADIAAAGPAQVTVFTPAPGGGESNAIGFNVVAPNPAPVLATLNPATVQAGSDAFTITATGSGFVAGSELRWNGVARPTTFISAGELRADITAADIATVGSAAVTVFSPAPGGGTSATLVLTIAPPPPPPPPGPTAVSAGGEHSCGTTSAGAAHCWGNGQAGQLGTGATTVSAGPAAVAGGHTFAQLSAGGPTTCALTAEGKAWCWGQGNSGRLGNGQSGSRSRPDPVSGGLTFVSIGTGANYSCAVATGGAAYCWGFGANGGLGTGFAAHSVQEPVAVVGGHTFASITVGVSHTCALTPDGTAYCWGENNSGQLGNGGGGDRAEPVPVSGGLRFTRLVAGGAHTCGLTEAGAAYCWGSNASGEVGVGSVGGNRTTPVAVAGGHTFTSISLGTWHVCGLRSDGAALCWGNGTRGQLGNGGIANAPSPVAVSGGLAFSAVSTAAYSTCGIANGQAYCWGMGGDGALGSGVVANQTTPAAVPNSPTFTSIHGGGGHACAITSGGAAWCWGTRTHGQLGDGLATTSALPVAVLGSHAFVQVTAGQAHSCGITAAGTAYCWGNGGLGRLGNGATAHSYDPVQVSGGLAFSRISAGFEHTCALTPDGAAWCWGNPALGRLGHGSTSGGLVPVAVAGSRKYTVISAGGTHTCAVAEDGAGYCWGYTDGGSALGNSPGLVGGGHTFSSIDAGGDLSCGVTTAGKGLCWGRNDFGQVGNGGTANVGLPAEVAGGHTFTRISAGGLSVHVHACGITTDGTAYCWGRNVFGQLGSGNSGGQASSPVAVTGGYRFSSISTGNAHTCGVTTDGLALCWGSGSEGRLGTGQTNSRSSPAPVTMSAGGVFLRW